MNSPEQSQLGKVASYADQYDPGLLFPLPRATQRAQLGITGQPVFVGADLWTAYELSWLNLRGKPQVALGRLVVPCESTHLVESNRSSCTSTVSTTAVLSPCRKYGT